MIVNKGRPQKHSANVASTSHQPRERGRIIWKSERQKEETLVDAIEKKNENGWKQQQQMKLFFLFVVMAAAAAWEKYRSLGLMPG